ncbi:arylsulfatase [Verrucomicrobiales bacterium]|nr:arylsulfatase [Verrucomicrobiales bacterium]MDB4358954.1 arylsulfatase [Verrucomicrobiales bacterium]
MRLNFQRWLLLLLLLLSGAGTAADRPNVVLIVCDDLGYSDIGCYGGEIETPNLDQLASEGLRFSQFYNAAVCIMTRAALYTGLYPRQGKGGLLRPQMATLGEVMREAGYATSMTGKWHLGSDPERQPINRGFDEFYGLLDGCSSFFNPAKPDPDFYNGGKVRTFAHNQKVQITDFPDDYYATDAFTDHAVNTIKTLAGEEKPFFINLNYTAPHFPLHALPEDIAKYRGKYADGYEHLRKRRYERLIELGVIAPTTRLSPSDSPSGSFRYDNEIVPWVDLDVPTRLREEARMEVYAAMVDRMDQGIGKVLVSLAETGCEKNTLVIFFSDNGGCASWPTPAKEPGFFEYNKGIPVGDPRGYEFVGKAWGWAQNSPFRKHKVWPYEGGIATPMIVKWPAGITGGGITHQPGHLVDLMPTLLELAETEYPEQRGGLAIPPMEGHTLVPVFKGKERTPPESFAWSFLKNHAYREGDWKIIWNVSPPLEERKWELYNLKTDRTEMENLAHQHPDLVKSMVSRWQKWRKRMELAGD